MSLGHPRRFVAKLLRQHHALHHLCWSQATRERHPDPFHPNILANTSVPGPCNQHYRLNYTRKSIPHPAVEGMLDRPGLSESTSTHTIQDTTSIGRGVLAPRRGG